MARNGSPSAGNAGGEDMIWPIWKHVAVILLRKYNGYELTTHTEHKRTLVHQLVLIHSMHFIFSHQKKLNLNLSLVKTKIELEDFNTQLNGIDIFLKQLKTMQIFI